MEKINLICVDAGASKKIDNLAKELSKQYEVNVIQCHKKRNVKTGEIEKLEVFSDNLNGLPCIIVDDIADGANSFIFCVKELQKIKGYKNSYLIVTHGIFSRGFNELLNYFDGIYCTNSFRDIPSLQKDGHPTNIKQLNVF